MATDRFERAVTLTTDPKRYNSIAAAVDDSEMVAVLLEARALGYDLDELVRGDVVDAVATLVTVVGRPGHRLPVDEDFPVVLSLGVDTPDSDINVECLLHLLDDLRDESTVGELGRTVRSHPMFSVDLDVLSPPIRIVAQVLPFVRVLLVVSGS